MLALMIGLISGAMLPVQTSVNTRLSRRLGAPMKASLISFAGGVASVLVFLFASGIGMPVPAEAAGEPFWIWIGGFWGVILVTLNLILLPRLGSVQTVIFAVLGQILTGVVIDHFGWFRAAVIPLTASRALGAILVLAGVILVSVEKTPVRPERGSSGYSRSQILGFRLAGILSGAAIGIQVAINGYTGIVLRSPFRATLVSFSGGLFCALVLCLILRRRGALSGGTPDPSVPNRWWLYSGGLLGVCCVAANVYLANALGTGMAVIVSLIGQILGGIVIDLTGFLGTERKPMSVRKAAGLLVMVCGAAMIQGLLQV
ncbi:MAG: DMT family transporter [Mogibacterium sp.]|nr:DMT family transporter [Mogibacterium sp.]